VPRGTESGKVINGKIEGRGARGKASPVLKTNKGCENPSKQKFFRKV
jgi:hypothetical protein